MALMAQCAANGNSKFKFLKLISLLVNIIVVVVVVVVVIPY